MTRRALPARRANESFVIEHDNLAFTIGTSRFPDGTLAEIFATSAKAGSAVDHLSRDAAIVASLALQFGCPAETLRHAVTRDATGRPTGLIGAVLDRLAVRQIGDAA